MYRCTILKTCVRPVKLLVKKKMMIWCVSMTRICATILHFGVFLELLLMIVVLSWDSLCCEKFEYVHAALYFAIQHHLNITTAMSYTSYERSLLSGDFITYGGVKHILSHFYPTPIIFSDLEFRSAEQLYQWLKASIFDDTVTAMSESAISVKPFVYCLNFCFNLSHWQSWFFRVVIMREQNPVRIKRFGRNVRRFSQVKWDSVKYHLMMSIDKLKVSISSYLTSWSILKKFAIIMIHEDEWLGIV